jgi:hypothetical protein
VAYDGGFLAQLKVLEQMAQQDHKILAILLLVDFVSFGFELAAVLAKITSFVPSTYAMHLARDAYMDAVKIVDDMVAELDKRNKPPTGTEPGGEESANPNGAPQDAANLLALPPPKRKRGRPRKHPRPPIKGSNDSGNSEAA